MIINNFKDSINDDNACNVTRQEALLSQRDRAIIPVGQ